MNTLIGLFIIFSPIIILYVSYRYHLLNLSKAFYFNRIKWKTQITRKRYVELDVILNKRISFYRHLSDNGKARFINRLQDLLKVKKFVAKKRLIISDEMKVVVCAAIVQLTFGLRKYELDNIKGFYIYPTIFYNSFMKVHLKGSTPPEGMISLSWKDLEHGFLVENDKYNLGLHEVAHALKLSLKYAYHFDVKFASYLEKWEQFGHVEFLKMKRGNESFLRKYGGVNEHEFFAVCIEHFFEVPAQFQENLPQIFYHLCILLNLDPLNLKKDYEFIKQ
jgi:Mlc titration factor MtfA (ptsG expression regulator)